MFLCEEKRSGTPELTCNALKPTKITTELGTNVSRQTSIMSWKDIFHSYNNFNSTEQVNKSKKIYQSKKFISYEERFRGAQRVN